jgi:uncharacterized protein
MADVLEQIQADTREAMKGGDKDRVTTLRMLSSAVQLDLKEGDGDGIAVLTRERKKRIEAADAYADAGRADQAEAERAEAELIAAYLPEQVSDEELAAIVDEAVSGTGATSMQDMGKVMGAVMPRVKGRADGNRVSAAVREKLGS